MMTAHNATSQTSAAARTPSGQAASRRPWSFATPLIGKAVRKAARLAHFGGSAFPGRIAETIDPGFLARTLGQLPLGVVLVSGTNGKTTTTRMVASVLENLGLKVFTNPTGSNFTRGVVSALLDQVTLGGRLDADIAVLELDEAYAVHFVRHQMAVREIPHIQVQVIHHLLHQRTGTHYVYLVLYDAVGTHSGNVGKQLKFRTHPAALPVIGYEHGC